LNDVESAAMRIGTTAIVSGFCSPRDNYLSLFLHALKDSRFGQPRAGASLAGASLAGASLTVLLRERCWRLFL
jgi:hypothetical protein